MHQRCPQTSKKVLYEYFYFKLSKAQTFNLEYTMMMMIISIIIFHVEALSTYIHFCVSMCAAEYMCIACRCLQRSEGSVASPGTGVTAIVNCSVQTLGTNLGPL